MRYVVMSLVGCLVLLQSLVSVHGQQAERGASLAILPFEIGETGSFSYLNNSLRQMLLSRLAQRGEVELVDPQLSQEQQARLRQELRSGKTAEAETLIDADWLADGTLQAPADGLVLKLTLYPLTGGGAAAEYTMRAANPEEVMPALTRLVEEIHQKSFSAEKPIQAVAVPAPATDGLSAFQTEHPERSYKKGLYGGASLFGGDQDERFQSKGVRQSANLDMMVESVALGDLDGDGSDEFVAASRSRIKVFRFQEGRFSQVAAYDFSPGIKIHMVNIADPGDTGSMKLLVSANDGKFPASAVFTWDGSSKLQVLRENISWYIRPVWWPDKGIILAGQKDSPNLSDNYLAPSVYELAIEPDWQVARGERLQLPENINLFDFVIADLNGDGETELMTISKQEKLQVYDAAFNLIWVSSANYGGSKRYFGPPLSGGDRLDPKAYDDAQNEMRKLVYIPGRMVTKDITGDGLPEVVVSTNQAGLGQYVNNIRSYEGGAIACLTWRGEGLLELWRTGHLQGYVADYAFETPDATGETSGQAASRLYVAQIPDSTIWNVLLPGGDNTRMLAYEMTVQQEQADTHQQP